MFGKSVDWFNEKSQEEPQKQSFRCVLEKKVCLEISQNPQASQASACNFIKKETLGQVFSYEFCEISNNTFSYRRPLVAASVVSS